jgi:hypothetical protein
MRLLDALARLSPRDPDPDQDAELRGALAVLEADCDAATVHRAADGAAVVAAAVVLLGSAVVRPRVDPASFPLVLLPAAGAWYTARRLPHLLATAVRTRALGAAPALVTRAVMQARLTPTAEAAAAFAAAGDDLLARRLRLRVRRARGTGRTGLGGFADEWGDRFPALGRGLRLIEAATAAPPNERARTLDRALDAVLDGTRDRAADGAARLRGPVTGVYAFGVLLPLALVAVLPAARVAGLPVSPAAVVLAYDVLLPAALVAAAAWLLAIRPVAFPPATVPSTHPDAPDGATPALVAGTGAAGVAGIAAAFLLPAWTPPLAAAGAGCGTGLAVRYRPVVAVRERVTAVEDGLPDAVQAVGRRVRDGTPVETAVAGAAADLDGPIAAVLADADRRARTLGVGVGPAFVGEHGALTDLPSRRTESVARLFAVAAREGRPAGRALVAMGEHLADLHEIERESRQSLRRTTATMNNTAAVFAPLVAGVTVGLAGRIGGDRLGAPAVQPSTLGPALGVYVLVLAAVLTALSTGLRRGVDRALVGYRVGMALLAATATYLAAVVAGGLVA